MKAEIISIANLKRAGCENTIERNLLKLHGVKQVVVHKYANRVIIEHETEACREQFTKVLSSLGYPETTEPNGPLMKFKSYVSCFMGSMPNWLNRTSPTGNLAVPLNV